MKKLLLAVPFIATASWAGTTLYSGSQTRPAYEDLIAQLDGMSAMHVSTESYSAGFSSSRAVTQVRASTAPDSRVLFRLQHDISHSPISVADGGAHVGAARIVTTLIDDQSEMAQKALALFDGDTPVVLESDVGFNRKVTNELRTAPFSIEIDAPDGAVNYSLGSMFYAFTLDADGKLVGTGEFEGGSMSLPDQGIDIVFGPGTDEFEYLRVGKAVFTGTQRAEFGTTTIEADGAPIATLDDVSIDLDSSLTNDLMAMNATLNAGEVSSPLPLDSMSFGIRFAGLDVAGIERSGARLSEMGSMDPENFTEEEILNKLLEGYAALATPGVSLDYDIEMSNAGGDISATAGVLFKGDGSASGYDSMTTVGELVRALRLSARVEADADAVAMTPAAMFLANDQLAPWVTFDGTQYRSKLSVDELIVDVNGNPMALEMMAGDMLALPLDLSMLLQMSGR